VRLLTCSGFAHCCRSSSLHTHIAINPPVLDLLRKVSQDTLSCDQSGATSGALKNSQNIIPAGRVVAVAHSGSICLPSVTIEEFMHV